MKYSVRRNKDSSLPFEKALEDAGYDYVKRPELSDFLLFDSENVGRRRELLKGHLKDRPGFIYPHTPQTCWLWDGVYQPLPVSFNFVYAPGPKSAMELYGYPYPVQVVGFPRCEILPFRPTTGTNLLFVPARPRKGDGGRQAILDQNTLMEIIRYRDVWDSVTVCRVDRQFPDLQDGYFDCNVITTNPRASANPAADMVERIDHADLVISTNTPAVLSAARGKPTVFYGEKETPSTITGKQPASYELYRHVLQFPLNFEDMSIDQVLEVRSSPNPKVDEWKRLNIGDPFDSDKFIEAVELCLRIE